LEFLQTFFPFGLQTTGDESILGVDSTVASLGPLDTVASAFEIVPELRHRALMIGVELFDGGETRIERSRRQGGEEGRRHGCIDLASPDAQTILTASVSNILARAVIAGRRVASSVIHLQTPTAGAADRDALQQGRTFSHRASRLMRTRTDVLPETLLVRFKSSPVDVARMMISDKDGPLAARAPLAAFAHPPTFIDIAQLMGFAIHVDAGIERIGQYMMDFGVRWRHPTDIVKRVPVQRKAQAFRAEPQPNTSRRSHFSEALKDRADRGYDRLIRMQEHFAVGLPAHQADRQSAVQFTARGLVADPAEEPRAQNVKFGLRHRALQSQHQPIVEQTRMIDPVGIPDERVGDTAQIEQTIPVGIVASEARDFQSQHETDMTQGHSRRHA